MSAGRSTAEGGGRDDRVRRPAAEMSPAEKVAAEWEARHDVAARGGRIDPLAVQHYLSRARIGEGRRGTGGAAGASLASGGHRADAHGTVAGPGGTGTPRQEDERPSWWRRLRARLRRPRHRS